MPCTITDNCAKGLCTPGRSRAKAASFRSISRGETPTASNCASRRAAATSRKSKYGSRRTSWAGRIRPRRCQRRITDTGTPSSSASMAGVYSRCRSCRGSTSPSRCRNCVSLMTSSVPASTARRLGSSNHSSSDSLSGTARPSSPTTTRCVAASALSKTVAPWRRANCAASRRVMLDRLPTSATRLPPSTPEASLPAAITHSANVSGTLRVPSPPCSPPHSVCRLLKKLGRVGRSQRAPPSVFHKFGAGLPTPPRLDPKVSEARETFKAAVWLGRRPATTRVARSETGHNAAVGDRPQRGTAGGTQSMARCLPCRAPEFPRLRKTNLDFSGPARRAPAACSAPRRAFRTRPGPRAWRRETPPMACSRL